MVVEGQLKLKRKSPPRVPSLNVKDSNEHLLQQHRPGALNEKLTKSILKTELN